MKIDKRELLSIVVILFFATLWFTLMYYRMPLGDDILGQHATGINLYLDNANKNIGSLVTSRTQVWNKMIYEYHVWNGRILGELCVPLLEIFGQLFTAIISVIVYTGIVLASGILAFGSLKGILRKPLAILVFSVTLFWYNAATGMMALWTMTCMYGMTMLLYLLYMVMLNKIISRKFVLKIQWIVLFNILGLIAGITNEALGAICIIVIMIRTFISIYQQKAGIKRIFIHVGLCVGYCFCFFSPGNFNRMNQSHDSLKLQLSILTRMKLSLKAHLVTLMGTSRLNLVILSILLFMFVITLLLLTRKEVKQLLINNCEYLIGIMASIIIWGLVSYTPSYGILLWLDFVLIFLFKNITVDEKLAKFSLVGVVSICLLSYIGVKNYGWLNDLRTTTTEWRTLIKEAKEKGQTEVLVPKYMKITNNYFTLMNNVNLKNQYKRPDYKSYYGIYIIIDTKDR
ncbi:hypothetical protein KTC96_21395 [Clostridium estertheticum]|uniref:DUF6056 family protein n=1 Tax=Clostridium estertheticum TaxID=238834 RepID=UPI001C7D71AC|nr:DUF6056 family protein [Clostridium estertheticum]MBX4260786.1 hypothetical protein [Clostridium estertheticum]WLC70348.1 hypothetical protein KTC96_21395 [Clostridium estertheticum]